MPARNRLKIWGPRVLVVLILYSVYVAAYIHYATCIASCGIGDANSAAVRAIGRRADLILLILGFGALGLIQIASSFWLVARGRSYIVYPHEYDVTFDDVRGQTPVVDSVRDVVKLFRGFQEFKEIGGFPPRGILFEGPPGTGKTLLGKAVAGEVGVPFIYASATSFNNVFMGGGSLRVTALFRKARKFVRQYDGCVIFIDEIDAIGSRGAGVSAASTERPAPSGVLGRTYRFVNSQGQGTGIVNELLVQMDGLIMPRGFKRQLCRLFHVKPTVPTYNLLVLGATNRASALDPALLRPGRFDRKIHVGLPDKEGRRDVIDFYLGKVKHKPLDIEKFAQVTMGYSPARIKNTINEALIVALQDGRDSLTWDDIWQAKLIDEIGLKQPVRYTDEEKVRTAVHEAGHAVAAHQLRAEDSRIQVITIIKRQEALGLVHSMEIEERFSEDREDVIAEIEVSLAGMAAEDIFFGTTTSGVSGDLQTATLRALSYIGRYGMGARLLSYGVIPPGVTGEPQGVPFMLGQREIREEVDQLLKQCRADVTELLRKNRFAIERLRDELLDREELVGDRLEALMEEIFTGGKAARTAVDLPPAAIT